MVVLVFRPASRPIFLFPSGFSPRLRTIMPDSAEQLQQIYLEGFELQIFERYPNCIGVLRDGCIALLRATPNGLEMVGTPGWRMGDVMGVLVERDGQQVFQAKQEITEATADRLEALQRFRDTLERLLAGSV